MAAELSPCEVQDSQMGYFDLLPPELHTLIRHEIFEAQALFSFFCVCKSWSVFAFDDEFWLVVCKKSFDLTRYTAPSGCTWRWVFLSKQPLTKDTGIGRKELQAPVPCTAEGEWVDGMLSGKGVKIDASGDCYVGDFLNNVRHGEGIFSSGGDTYTGSWKEDRRNGHGTLVWRSTARYCGNFVDDYREGFGKYTWANGDHYEGEWHLSLRTGKGKIVWAEGNSYDGEWEEGFQNGQGVYKWVDGDRFEGGWLKNTKHGKGKYTWGCGDESEGMWENDAQVGEGSLVWRNGNTFFGEWVDGVHEIGQYMEKATGRVFTRRAEKGAGINLKDCHPQVVEHIKQNKCTFMLTNKVCYFQYLWKTKEIDVRTHGVCVSCYNTCVPMNRVKLLEPEKHYFGGNFWCDCGAGNLDAPCRANGTCHPVTQYP